MQWIGANPHPEIIKGDKADGYYTYLKKREKKDIRLYEPMAIKLLYIKIYTRVLMPNTVSPKREG